MALGAWSRRRIAALWLLGIGFYGTLAILGYRQRRAADAEFRAQYGLLGANESQLRTDTFTDASRDSSFALLFALWREASRGTPAHRDSILHELSVASRDTARVRQRLDSIYRALNVPARLDSAQQDSLRVVGESVLGAVLAPALRGVDSAMKDLTPWLLLWSVLFLAPAVALIVTTIAWAVLRRRHGLSSGVPAA